MATTAPTLGDSLAPMLRRRHRRDRGMTLALTLLMGAIAALLVWILVYVALKGVNALDLGFLTDTPPGNPSDAGGGFYNGIIGSLEIVGIATLLSLPLGVGCAIYLNQYATGRVAGALRLVTDVMLGIPTIVTGAFVYAIWVINFGFSGYAGAFALALVMVPLITRATEEMLRLVPERHPRGELRAGRDPVAHDRLGAAADGAAGDHHRRHAGDRPRDGRDGAPAADGARQRPLRRVQSRRAHVDALAADLQQRDRRLRERAGSRLGGSAHVDRHRPAADDHGQAHRPQVGDRPMTPPERHPVTDLASADETTTNGASAPVAATPAGSGRRMDVVDLNAGFGTRTIIQGINLAIEPNAVTALIGPSGCGKSTLLRCMNAMHSTAKNAFATGQILLDGQDINARGVDPVLVRRRVGMVFQRPNPFPTMSIYDNVAAGLRLTTGKRSGRHHHDEVVERALRQADLWDEVKDRLRSMGGALSGGQQQRLCIARALAVEPEVLLMDEPCSALDPISTAKIEELDPRASRIATRS